jgi:hypothetical protein
MVLKLIHVLDAVAVLVNVVVLAILVLVHVFFILLQKIDALVFLEINLL